MPAHDFNRLSSFDFEELICDLLQAEWKTRLEIFTPGRDRGIDLRAFADSKTETIIQCKHTPNTSFASLLSQLRREELPKVTTLGPNRYVLVTSLGLTPENKKTLVKLFQPYLKRQADVFGRTEINALLRRHPKVETNNFKLWLTSTAVLQRVLHNAEHSQTEFEVDRVSRKVPLFVQNDAFPRAQAILDQSRVVVISGEPGIGKTTLAEMLLFAHLEQDFESVVIESGIEEAKRLFSRTRKQIFYFDVRSKAAPVLRIPRAAWAPRLQTGPRRRKRHHPRSHHVIKSQSQGSARWPAKQSRGSIKGTLPSNLG
jgi:hypothetical protein